MCFVLGLLPGLVGPAFVVVPGMTIRMVTVVVSIVGQFCVLSLAWIPKGAVEDHPVEATLDTDAVAACILLKRNSMVVDPLVPLVRHQL